MTKWLLFAIKLKPHSTQLHPNQFVRFNKFHMSHYSPTWFHELLVEAAPGLFALLQVLLHDLDVGEGTVALWEAGGAPAPAVIVSAEQLTLWVARHVAEGRLHKTPTQELWQDILQAWKAQGKILSLFSEQSSFYFFFFCIPDSGSRVERHHEIRDVSIICRLVSDSLASNSLFS